MKCQKFHLAYVLYSQQTRDPRLQRSELNAPLKAEKCQLRKLDTAQLDQKVNASSGQEARTLTGCDYINHEIAQWL